MISVSGLEKRYKSGDEFFYALNGASLEIGDGQFVSVAGKSGSGKSTLLNILGTLDRATGGKVIIDGQDISLLNGRKLAAFRSLCSRAFTWSPNMDIYTDVLLKGSSPIYDYIIKLKDFIKQKLL